MRLSLKQSTCDLVSMNHFSGCRAEQEISRDMFIIGECVRITQVGVKATFRVSIYKLLKKSSKFQQKSPAPGGA